MTTPVTAIAMAVGNGVQTTKATTSTWLRTEMVMAAAAVVVVAVVRSNNFLASLAAAQFHSSKKYITYQIHVFAVVFSMVKSSLPSSLNFRKMK